MKKGKDRVKEMKYIIIVQGAKKVSRCFRMRKWEGTVK